MSKDNHETNTQKVAYGWQLITPENTIVTDNDQGYIVILDNSDDFSNAPAITLKVSETETTIQSSSYFEQGVSITLDKKIIVTRRPDIELED
ncbi:hypothetical protein [Leuconostoc pseudomesenteroides]|uniref:hypothetical protein n=1 Tax=Leuconostoc pseudomesenteroides TaxID=33968 RepID=UPI00301C3293